MIPLESITLLPSWGLPGTEWGTRWPRFADVPKGEGGSFEVMCRWEDGVEHKTTCYPWAPAGEGIQQSLRHGLKGYCDYQLGRSGWNPGEVGPETWAWVRNRDFGDWTFSINYYLDRGIAELARKPIVHTITIEEIREAQRGIAEARAQQGGGSVVPCPSRPVS